MKKTLFVLVLLISVEVSFATPSKKELFSRARDALKTSLESKDFARSRLAIDYLKQNLAEGAPLSYFEEYLALMEMGEYDEAIPIYADTRRLVLDSTYSPRNDRLVDAGDDVLRFYLFRNFTSFTKTKADSLIALVDSSDAKQQNKALFKALVYADIVIILRGYSFGGDGGYFFKEIADTTAAEDFLKNAKQYVEEYSHCEHARYLKEQTIPFVEKYMAQQRLFQKDPIAHKFYTGGLGLYIGTWSGFVSGEITDYVKDKMAGAFQLEAQLRYKRFALSFFMEFGLNNQPKWNEPGEKSSNRDGTEGLTLGFNAYDSHALRVEPFVGIAQTHMGALEDYYIVPHWVLGTNVDVRFFATKPERVGSLSVAFLLRVKYKVMFGTAEPEGSRNSDYPKSFGAVYHMFGVSLGVNLW